MRDIILGFALGWTLLILGWTLYGPEATAHTAAVHRLAVHQLQHRRIVDGYAGLDGFAP